MPDPADPFLEAWHRAVADRDPDAVAALLAPGVSIGAPPYWQRLEGEALVGFLLGLILTAIEGFTYHREWRDGRELALEFRGRIDGRDLQGIDLISLDEDGRVARLDVLIRPVNAVEALIAQVAPKMQAYLAQQK